MKSILLLIACTLAVCANTLTFEHDFTQAQKKAKQEHKQVMMMYSAVWCPECNYMKDVVFKDHEVVSYIQKHYVVLTLVVQKNTLPEGFDYPGIPVFFFLDDSAKEKDKIIGGSKANIFLQKLKGLQ